VEWRLSGSLRPKIIPSAKIRWKISRLVFGIKTASSSLIIFQRAKLSTRSYYSSLLVQLKDILKVKRRGKIAKEVKFVHDNAPTHRVLATQKKMAYQGF